MQILLRNCPFSKMVRKTKFLIISVLVSEIVTFWIKRKVPYKFLQKCNKTTERHSLAVCGSLREEKLFLLIFVPFYSVWSKTFVKTEPNFPPDLPLSNMARKTNFLSFSVLVSEIVTFMSKKKSSLWISPKMLQNNIKA